MSVPAYPQTISEYIEAIREGLTCARCGRYVGNLGATEYVPPPYPIALDKITSDDEVEALIGFEWHMLGLVREGRFVIRHPQSKGRCVSIREWLAEEDDDDAGDEG